MAAPDRSPCDILTNFAFADIPGAQRLVEEAGWNQVRSDWETFLAIGKMRNVRDGRNDIVATAATLPYAGGFGWVSMVLVTKASQRQGLATALLAHCIADLRSQELASVLDATPAGRAVYQRLGFIDGWAISRWHRGRKGFLPAAPTATRVRPMLPSDLQTVTALDAAAFGCARPALLERLFSRSSAFACLATEATGHPSGFLLGRDGRNATQFGPLVAPDQETAVALIDHALARNPGPVMIDVLERHPHVARALEARGFSIQRPFTRMTLDRDRPFGDDRLMMAIAGPELG